jgi:hypothetical protein
LNNPAFSRAKVKDLGPEELKAIIEGWCPQVEAAWNRLTCGVQQTYRAIMIAKDEHERRVIYNRANPVICKALRRLRARGLVGAAKNNDCIRLTPKGRQVARKLATLI